VRTILLSTLGALIFLGPDAADAQVISGFASIPWGASRAEIEAEWGTPARVDEEGTLILLRYAAPDLTWPETIRGWQMVFGVRNDRLRRSPPLLNRGRGQACAMRPACHSERFTGQRRRSLSALATASDLE
jgi:hypothetical protein